MDDDGRYSLTELTERADVSVRTVRYYIGEGLLPPPVAAGARSYYTDDHLARLRLIGRLKEAYLPLKEIRRRLAGLDAAEVRRLAEEAPPAPALDSAADYIERVRAGLPPRRPSPAATPPPMAPLPRTPGLSLPRGLLRRRAAEPEVAEEETEHLFPSAPEPPAREAPLPLGAVTFGAALPTLEEPSAELAEAMTWRRVSLSDDAELLIREEAYQRKRERVDWLVRWARKVFG